MHNARAHSSSCTERAGDGVRRRIARGDFGRVEFPLCSFPVRLGAFQSWGLPTAGPPIKVGCLEFEKQTQRASWVTLAWVSLLGEGEEAKGADDAPDDDFLATAMLHNLRLSEGHREWIPREES